MMLCWGARCGRRVLPCAAVLSTLRGERGRQMAYSSSISGVHPDSSAPQPRDRQHCCVKSDNDMCAYSVPARHPGPLCARPF